MWSKPSHRHAGKAFTLIEVMVVLTIIGLTAALAAYYGKELYYQYTFSSFVRSVENAVEVARMRAPQVHSGNRVRLRFTSATNATFYYTQEGVDIRPKGTYFLVVPKKSLSDRRAALRGDVDLEMLYQQNMYRICLLQSGSCSNYYPGNPALPENREVRFNSRGFLEGYRPITVLLEDVRQKRTTNLCFDITALGEVTRGACSCNCP